MSDARHSSALEMRWLSVRTASGRVCMEAVWITVESAVPGAGPSAVPTAVPNPAAQSLGRGHAA